MHNFSLGLDRSSQNATYWEMDKGEPYIAKVLLTTILCIQLIPICLLPPRVPEGLETLELRVGEPVEAWGPWNWAP